MRKSLSLFILSICLLTEPLIARPTNDWINEHLKGQVKEWENYSVSSVGKQEYRYVTKFSKAGKIIQRRRYDDNDKLDWKEEFKYNAVGYLIEKLHFKSGILEYKHTYQYRDGNLTIEVQVNSDGSLIEEYIYNYDCKRNKVLMQKRHPNAVLDFKYIFKYDDKNRLIELNRYNITGNTEYKSTYQYG